MEPAENPIPSRPRLLIVDDDDHLAELIAHYLEPHGFELFDSGYAQNKDSKLFATRCAAGQVFRNYRCTGES